MVIVIEDVPLGMVRALDDVRVNVVELQKLAKRCRLIEVVQRTGDDCAPAFELGQFFQDRADAASRDKRNGEEEAVRAREFGSKHAEHAVRLIVGDERRVLDALGSDCAIDKAELEIALQSVK